MKPPTVVASALLASVLVTGCNEDPVYYFVADTTSEGPDDVGTDATLVLDTLDAPDTAIAPDTTGADTTGTDTAVAPDTTIVPDAADTGTTDTPDAESSAYCTNEADFAIVTATDLDDSEEGDQTVISYAQSCGLGCLADADTRTCSVACIVADTGASEDCAGCYGDTVLCTIENCLADCAIDPNSASCSECQANNCLSAFYACTGL